MPTYGNIHIAEDSTSAEAKSLQRRAQKGEIRRIHDGIYVDADVSDVEKAVFDRHMQILAKVAPGAVLSGISGRKAMPHRDKGQDGRPTWPGWLFATHDASQGTSRKSVTLPGLEIRTQPGAGKLDGDYSHLGCFIPSSARQALENLMPSRGRNGPARTMGRAGVEQFLAAIIERGKAADLEALRENARRIAVPLGATKELSVLEEIVAGLLRERVVEFATSDLNASRRSVDPYDQSCLDRLAALAIELSRTAVETVDDPHTTASSRECVAFVEAYFSNYIEGTKFLVEKARRIVFDGEIANSRHADSHDILQTYRQVVQFARQARELDRSQGTATTFESFLDEMRERHSILMAARPEVRPGMLKVDRNRAGNHVFVAPDLVVGTLREGFAASRSIDDSHKRGLYLHCLSVLVHPFDDGNGRISRILMNREIVAGGQCRVVVPTIFRSDYIGAMRALTRPDGAAAAPFVRAMTTCRDTTAAIVSDDLDETIRRWASTNAFLEDEKDAKLEMPNDLPVEIRDGIPAPASYWRTIDDLGARRSELGIF